MSVVDMRQGIMNLYPLKFQNPCRLVLPRGCCFRGQEKATPRWTTLKLILFWAKSNQTLSYSEKKIRSLLPLQLPVCTSKITINSDDSFPKKLIYIMCTLYFSNIPFELSANGLPPLCIFRPYPFLLAHIRCMLPHSLWNFCLDIPCTYACEVLNFLLLICLMSIWFLV